MAQRYDMGVHDEPDIMNDPNYATNFGDEGNGEPDTCRICRGEATVTEPLFYPCKCSGSIKFVHQDCLMEWLSHSQKKHCELCKTPFRFTKLYAPDMPQSLPTLVFMQHLFIHTVRNMTTWLRFCLVVVVWLGWLPWTMRQVWGFLFWFGDGGWNPSKGIAVDPGTLSEQTLQTAREAIEFLTSNATSPATPLLQSDTCSAMMSTLFELPSVLLPYMQGPNNTESFTTAVELFKALIQGFGISLATNHSDDITHVSLFNQTASPLRYPTLLSDVQFLTNLTSNAGLNRIIISTLEGQIITVLVVVCFILVFLIREWVVQQQPGLNMGVGFNPDMARVEPRDMGMDIEEEPPMVAPVPAIQIRPPPGVDGEHIIARPRRRVVHFDQNHDAGHQDAWANLENEPRVGLANDFALPHNPDEATSGRSSPTARPQMHAMSSAVEIQRRLTDDTSYGGATDVSQFLSIWRRAEGRPEEVLRIMEEEGLTDKMSYWANAMARQTTRTSQSSPSRPVIVDEIDRIRRQDAQDIAEARQRERQYRGGSIPEDAALMRFQVDNSQFDDGLVEEWTSGSQAGPSDSGRPSFYRQSSTGAETRKGKEKAPEFQVDGEGDGELFAMDSSLNVIHNSGAGRPRATSDGPPLKGKSLLANDNWAFPSLSPDAPTASYDTFGPPPSSPRPFQTEFSSLPQFNRPSTPQSPESSTRDTYPSPAESPVREPPTTYAPRTSSLNAISQEQDSPGSSTTAASQSGFPTTAIAHPNELDVEEIPASEGEQEDEVATPATPPRESETAQAAVPQQGMLGRLTDFLWGDLGGNAIADEAAGNDEHIVQDLAAEAPFVPVNGAGHPMQEDVDREVAAAAVAAGIDPNDPDAIDDAEDFEGIMELIGMRGPLTGLVQNGMFSAVLISLTVACGVWIPYNIGRLVVLLVANPIPTVKLPLKILFSFAAFIQDLTLLLIGGLTWLGLFTLSLLIAKQPVLDSVTSEVAAEAANATISAQALSMTLSAGDRITWSVFYFLQTVVESEIPAFSAVSHEALISIKGTIAGSVKLAFSSLYAFLTSTPLETVFGLWDVVKKGSNLFMGVAQQFSTLLSLPSKPGPWVLSLDIMPRESPLDPALAQWGGVDRFWAIVIGYATLSILGSLYLRKGMPFSRHGAGREWETALIDMLHQAGGVMKVILIISIEMLVFPLYCGLLLDFALLPLFENVTIASRLAFTMNSPLTSIFVHWFVGTCYMFHFALFVSMCRKIMRPGVLYFIRDPDDPTFHPVRDVLERNVGTQLRKITFSALVYGGLVVVCLGGVVWGLSYSFNGVLPIHWSSNEPVLEFPIDLLFYNFFMPLAVRFFKPSDGLRTMYTWWFRKCARMLRLTWFLFDERQKDEEGRHVRKQWIDIFRGLKGDVEHPMSPGDAPFEKDSNLEVYFHRDGHYVRCPASDQVRIPKGTQVFLEVDEDNNRLDGHFDRPDGLHGRESKQYTKVYIPPHFRYRIFLFILFIWLFAAATGVCMTIIPLVFGREIFSIFIPDHVAKNDIYAFSMGICILGSATYAAYHASQGAKWARDRFGAVLRTPAKVARRLSSAFLYGVRLAYAYTAVGLIIPALYAMVIEFYFIIPLHTYFAGHEKHVVHFVQSWTLGLLYVKLTTRFILWYDNSRPARALRSITRDGYWNPDVRLATRAFILPATSVLISALVLPLPLAWILTQLGALSGSRLGTPQLESTVYRYAYPMFLALCIVLMVVYSLVGVLKGWKQRIRDEVYLIGERLHNFGERKSSSSATMSGVARSSRIET